MSRDLGEGVRGQIIALNNKDMSQPKIAEKVSVSKGAVQQILQRFKETGSFSTSDLYRIKDTDTKQKYHCIRQRRA